MATYIYREDSGYDERFEAANEAAAEAHALELLRTGDYGQEQSGRTFRVRAQVTRVETGEDGGEYQAGWRTVTHTFQPAEPACTPADAAHDWQEESVRGSGGGVLIRESCGCCDLVRLTDTWGSDPVTGEVMETVTYKHAAASL